MSQSRRDFIKVVIAGAAAASCPITEEMFAASAGPRPAVDGEQNEICHKVRDGFAFRIPPASAHRDVVIVGGGISGLAAAHFLPDHDWLLLEKESHWGGNAYAMEYDGTVYATGAAFMIDEQDDAAQLARELGLSLLPIEEKDGTILKGEFIPDMWGENLDRIPYPATVRERFKQFKKAMMAVDLKKRMSELDQMPLTAMLKGYGPEVLAWWDCYGPSNWGAVSAETSAYVAISDFQDFANEKLATTHNTWPGGNGALTKVLSERLLASNRDRMLTGATIVSVRQDKNEALVTYLHDKKLTTVAAKGVIMATPKFITARLVQGLPEAQRVAMRTIRYCPYPVVNLIYDKPVFNKAYDTWCPGNSFTDVIVADWTVRKQPGYKQKYNILTFYTPLKESQRAEMLTESGSRAIAMRVLRDFKKVLPDTNVDPVEIHIFRRGHPMFIATPGTFTRWIPTAKKPMRNIFFANTDSEGPVSLTAGGIAAAKRCIREFQAGLKGSGVPVKAARA
ncbi:MAG: FAD-dependent oxidoreductase [Acidobacteriales bacterium]|nr:FAD-dependent oxidoreductase [Terriglobales bacterium]